MASGVFVGIASLAFSFARPLDRMHPVRPLSSVFHPANLFSMLGQLAIHLACMVFIAGLAKEAMGEEAVKDIIEFEKASDSFQSISKLLRSTEAFRSLSWQSTP